MGADEEYPEFFFVLSAMLSISFIGLFSLFRSTILFYLRSHIEICLADPFFDISFEYF